MTKRNKILPGVHPKGGRFRAKAYRGRSVYLGTYDTPEEAHAKYLEFINSHPPAKPGVSSGTISKTLTPAKNKRKLNNDLRGTWLFGL